MLSLSKKEIYEKKNKFIFKPQEFRKEYCHKCINKTIIETYYDEDAAFQYLKSIGEDAVPNGVSLQAHVYGAELIAHKHGDTKDFHRIKVYECPHKYCEGVDKSVDFAVQDIIKNV